MKMPIWKEIRTNSHISTLAYTHVRTQKKRETESAFGVRIPIEVVYVFFALLTLQIACCHFSRCSFPSLVILKIDLVFELGQFNSITLTEITLRCVVFSCYGNKNKTSRGRIGNVDITVKKK